MSKIGLYVQVTSDPDIRHKLERLRPGVVLVHLDGGDLPTWIKQTMPETFVIGRYFWTPQQQASMLYATGAALANVVMGVKHAESCDAYMLFNEFITSPVDNGGLPEYRAQAQKYDALQVEYRDALVKRGKEAVAFNFAAGNWPTSDHYREHFPLTLASHRYLGFHVYGWPRIVTADWRSNLGETLRICRDFSTYTCVFTEMAVTRMYGNQGPDQGWQSQPEPIPLHDYVVDLTETNKAICIVPNVLGACLFNAAPDYVWTTFSVPDNLVERLGAIPDCPAPEPAPAPKPKPKPPVKAIALRLPFDGDYPLTQVWGANPHLYKPFKLKGHEGVDWGLPEGTPVLAVADGIVDWVDSIEGADPKKDPYGKFVRVKHNGFTTWYAHLSRVDVKVGQEVKAGQQIGLSGNTGNSGGAHLHLSFRLDGANEKDGYLGRSDPMPYMQTEAPPKPPDVRVLLEEAQARLGEAIRLLAP